MKTKILMWLSRIALFTLILAPVWIFLGFGYIALFPVLLGIYLVAVEKDPNNYPGDIFQ